MDEDKISVISIKCLSFEENQREEKQEKDKVRKDNETSPWNICHMFSIIAICVVFLAMVTLVPRTNSILYQSYWYEFNFCALPLMFLRTASDALSMSVYLNGEQFLSFRTLLKTFSLYLMAWVVPYVIAYLVWCQFLNYNWPIPYLGGIFLNEVAYKSPSSIDEDCVAIF